MNFWSFILSKPQDKSSKFAERAEKVTWAFESFPTSKDYTQVK